MDRHFDIERFYDSQHTPVPQLPLPFTEPSIITRPSAPQTRHEGRPARLTSRTFSNTATNPQWLTQRHQPPRLLARNPTRTIRRPLYFSVIGAPPRHPPNVQSGSDRHSATPRRRHALSHIDTLQQRTLAVIPRHLCAMPLILIRQQQP